MANNAEIFGSGNIPVRSDTRRMLLVKEVNATLAGGGSPGTGFNNLTGNGSPVGVKTPDYVGQYYTDLTAPYGIWFSTGLANANWTQIAGN